VRGNTSGPLSALSALTKIEPARDWRATLARWWALLAEALFSIQPERLIRLCRLFFSVFALLAVYLDPTQPARNVQETYAVLAAFILYSAVLAVAPSREALNSRIHYLTYGIDAAVLTLLCLLSGELASPFWAFVSFLLIVSAMRWGFLGSLASAFMMIALFVVIGWPYYDPSTSDLNTLIMRSAYSLVAAVMLGYFASYRERNRLRLANLADWPIEAAANEGEPWLESSLRHASEVLSGLRLLVVWHDCDEPKGRLAYWDGQSCVFFEVPGDGDERLTYPPHARFQDGPLSDIVDLPEIALQHLRFDRVHIAPDRPACAIAPFETPNYRGQVFVIDPGHPNDDMLSLTEIVAGRIAYELEQFALMQELASAAGWRERGRLARDLHDSVLQDLTAVGLQLKIASQQQPEQMQTSILAIGTLLQEQQRRIRSFVESTRPQPEAEPQLLEEQLDAFSRPLRAQWGCALRINVSPGGIRVSGRILTAICQIVSEGTANAVRHGGASVVDIAVRASGEGLELSITDDGSGMADVKPEGENRPQSIRARVADLGGRVALRTSSRGLAIRIWLPL